MEKASEIKDLTPLEKIILFAFISLMVGLYHFVSGLMILNKGFGDVPYIRLYLQVLPALYIIHLNFRKSSLRAPHLMSFITMISAFILFEYYFSFNHEYYPHNYHFVWQQIRIYIFFLMLINFRFNQTTFYKVIDFAFYSGLFICIATYGGYLGYYHTADLTYFALSLADPDKPSHILNVNQVSYLFSFTLLLMIIKQLNEKNFSPLYLIRDFAVIVLICGMIAINGSRGASIIAAIFVLYYTRYIWEHRIKDMNIKMMLISLILVFTLILFGTTSTLIILNKVESQVTLIKRFHQLKASTVTRIINIQNTWDNFREHPLRGVGYYKAAKRNATGTRSNNQYLQLLASSGLIFFIIYIYFHYRLVLFRLSLLKKPEIALSLVYCTISIIFARPLHIFAISGYIAFYFYHKSIRENCLEYNHQ